MKAILIACLVFVSISTAGTIIVSDPNVSLSEQQKESISAWLNVLAAVYDNDTSLIPDDPNEIIALETSENPRDLIAWQIFKMLRYELDPNSSPPDKNIPVVSNEPNRDPLPFTLTTDIAVNTMETESLQEGQESQQAPAIVSVQSMEQIEELSNPLGPRILESKTYRIVTLPLEIEGHVVIPAGTKLIAPFDPNNNIIEVMPGGLLDMGKAVNYSDPNYPDILPPVEILPEDPNQYFRHNNIGIYVQRGANPLCHISNTIVNHCRIGIIVDEALTSPIQNTITFGCYDGIYLYTPNTIIDSEFWLYGAVSEGFYNYIGAGIYIDLDGWNYPYPSIEINRTVAYGGDVGIFLESHDLDPNAADPNHTVGSLEVVNSIMFYNYYFGIYKTEGPTNIDLGYCAFGDNYWDSNFELPITGCVGLSYDPFYILSDKDRRLFMAPWSEAINAGYGFAEDGTGTCDYQPDIGQMDIGCHFPIGVSGSFGIPSSPADFNWDGIVDEWDLQLMNDCMGAIADPNIVKIDTNYDSRVNLPDFGLFASDYGYDPNNPDNNDPNSERSDFNFDHRVDLADLEVLAQNWLTLVFDEHRICTLCNLHTGADPNDPNAPGGAGVIDQRDMDAFMADWYKQSAFDPNIFIEQTASKVSIAVGNPEPAWKISAFFDDEPVGQWISEELGSSAFDVDLTRYGPGSHKVKIVRNIGYGLEINERIITDPNSTGLYFADIPDTFEPNEPYNIRGFNCGDELNIKIKDIYDQPIYDVNVPSGPVALEIPPEVFDANQICTLRLEGGGYSPEGFGIFAAGESQSRPFTEEDMVRKFRKEDYDNQTVQMVIITPDKKIFEYRKSSIEACARACNARNVNWVALYYTDVTPENLTYLLHRPTVRYVYWCGDGNSHVGRTEEEEKQDIGGVPRTCMTCWKPGKHWWNLDEKSRAFSYFDLQKPLPDDWDHRGFSLWSIHMYDTVNKWIVFVDCCRSAVFDIFDVQPDMARTFGIFNSGNNNQIYIGWYYKITTTQSGPREIFSPRNFEKYKTKIDPGIIRFWEKMGTGSTVEQALEATTQASYLGEDTPLTLWGSNTKMDLAVPNSDDSIRVYGNGLTNKLSNSN